MSTSVGSKTSSMPVIELTVVPPSLMESAAMCEWQSMIPGDTNLPAASTMSAPAGIETLAPSAAILPLRSTIVPFGIVPRVTVRIVAPLIAVTAAGGGAVCVCARGWTAMSTRARMAKARRITISSTVRLLPRASSRGRWTLLLRRRPGGRLEEVLVEPFQVVFHHGAVALGLAGPVADAAEAFVDDQLHRHVLILQSLIQLERVGRRDALI